MSQPTAAQWATLDTSDIASINSEDLHTHRPNRWQGPESTWRALTEEERSLYQSLKTRENQDLSAHLFNAFSLKQRSRDPELAEDLEVVTEDGGEAVWAPPRMWTAWPLAQGRLPVEEFVARREDEDEDFTFRREGEKLPGDDLREEVSASMLRMAKKKFLKRKNAWDAMQTSVEDEGDGGEDEDEDEDEDETEAETTEGEMEVDGASDVSGATSVSTRQPTRTYEPVVSADEELSRRLLEPSVHHIMSKLDSTLNILHHLRTTGERDNDDESESDTSVLEEAEQVPEKMTPQPKPSTTRRGRPKKVHIPREGETHEEMLIRIAREGHRRVPGREKSSTPRNTSGRSTPRNTSRDARNTIGALSGAVAEDEEHPVTPKAKKQNKELTKGAMVKQESQDDTDVDAKFQAWLEREDAPDTKTSQPRRKRALQGWSEVVGAASLAGFPPDVIARTVQRCADLFGEGMTIRNLKETSHEDSGVVSKEYRPQPISLSDSEDELPDSGDDMPLDERRRLSLRTSRLQSEVSPSKSPSRSRSRSRSVSRPGTPRSPRSLHYCPMPDCERAARGFPRRGNLRRHMDLVHKGATLDESASSAQSASEVDSEDEMHGAVHVDGFLKPVVPSKGWRGEDTETRKRKKGWSKRHREQTDDTAGDESAT